MDEEDLGSIGFMFDAQHQKVLKLVEFSSKIAINLKLIGDQPGHVQSGQYLWPAAKAAGDHLISNWSLLQSDVVMELGAGCGLTGLVTTMLEGVNSVIFTDYDHGSIDLINESIVLNCGENHGHFVHLLEWGKPISKDIRTQFAYPESGFKLIIGTDLLYCIEVVLPLFSTVNDLLLQNGGVFMLTTSFHLEEVVNLINCKFIFKVFLIHSSSNLRLHECVLNFNCKSKKWWFWTRQETFAELSISERWSIIVDHDIKSPR
jgi:predicted nicotinamide N-methyase